MNRGFMAKPFGELETTLLGFGSDNSFGGDQLVP